MNDTRERILDEALKLFLQKNYKGVTMKDIVKSTGLSKGAFYHYFESKEKIFEEVINSLTVSFAVFESLDCSKFTLAEFYRYIADFTNEFQEKLFKKNVTHATDSSFTANFYFMMFDGIILIPDFRQKMLAYQKKELNAWVSVITRAKRSGEIKSTMPDSQIAKIFISTSDGIMLGTIIGDQFDTLKKELLKTWDSFYKLLKN